VRGPGELVLWLYDEEDDSIGIAVGAMFPNRPLVATSFVQRHNVVEVFLGVAELDAEVPSELIARLPREFELPSFDAANRKRLRAENDVALSHLPVVTAPPTQGGGTGGGGGCSSSFKTWVAGVYGSPSCGQSGFPAFTWSYPTDTYCAGGGCTYELGLVDKGSCSPSPSCDIVQGKTHYRNQRLADWNGNPTISYSGRWAHYGAANCSGNGSIVFKTQRGGSVKSHSVPVNGMWHYPNGQGKWSVPSSAETNVSYGGWDFGLPPSGTFYKTNKASLENNAGANDRAILCGDVRHKYTMTDVSAGNCHGPNVWLCGNGVTCTNACYHCVGGSCG
jgi:hypothetical protein